MTVHQRNLPGLPASLAAVPARSNFSLVHQRLATVPVQKDSHDVRDTVSALTECSAALWRGVDLAAANQRLDRLGGVAREQARDGTFDHLFADGRSVEPLLVGSGNTHAIETGLTLHHTLGVPYLPGSAIKGLTRSWAELVGLSGDLIERLFGWAEDDRHRRGSLEFHDALPLDGLALEPDIVNCHLPAFYARRGNPHAVPKEDPRPSYFLRVRSGCRWRFRIGHRGGVAHEVLLAFTLLGDALSNLGMGAKTAAGYGAIELDPSARTEPRRKTVLLRLDLQGDGPVEGSVDDEVRLTALGARMDAPQTWADATGQVLDRLQALFSGADIRRLVVTGHAPLPAYAWMGHRFRGYGPPTTLLHTDVGGGRTDAYHADVRVTGARWFGEPVLGEARDQPGLVTVSIATRYEPAGSDRFDIVDPHAHVSVRAAETTLTPARYGDVRRDLYDLFAAIRRTYPAATGVSVGIEGPTPLAWLVGQAVNPNVFHGVDFPRWDPSTGYQSTRSM